MIPYAIYWKLGEVFAGISKLKYEQLFEDSYTRVIGKGIGLDTRGRQFFHRFYEIFFNRSEDIRQKFSGTDMEAQVGILEKSMFHMVSFYVTRTDTDFLHSIARTHNRNGYDIKPEYYDIWLESLLDTVRELDPEFQSETELAWRLAMTPGIEFMKFHYGNPENQISRGTDS